MASETKIPPGWTAFVKGSECIGYQEFKKGGKYLGLLSIVSKDTEAELKAELKRLKVTLPK